MTKFFSAALEHALGEVLAALIVAAFALGFGWAIGTEYKLQVDPAVCRVQYLFADGSYGLANTREHVAFQ